MVDDGRGFDPRGDRAPGAGLARGQDRSARDETAPGEARIANGGIVVGHESGAAASRSRRGGFGLTAMRSRVAELGGTFSLESAPGEGTALAVHLPLDPGVDPAVDLTVGQAADQAVGQAADVAAPSTTAEPGAPADQSPPQEPR